MQKHGIKFIGLVFFIVFMLMTFQAYAVKAYENDPYYNPAIDEDEYSSVGHFTDKDLADVKVTFNKMVLDEGGYVHDVGWYSEEAVAQIIYGYWSSAGISGKGENCRLDSLDAARKVVNNVWTSKYYSSKGIPEAVVKRLHEQVALMGKPITAPAAMILGQAISAYNINDGLMAKAGVLTVASSGGLIDSANRSIYYDSENHNYKLDLSANNGGVQDDVGWFEKGTSALVRSIANGMVNFMADAGIDMTTAIFGRVNGNGVRSGNNVVAPFTFELETGNTFGVVGAAVYSVIMRYAYLFMAFATFIMLCKLIFVRGRQGFEALAGVLKNSLFCLFLIMSMPYFLEVIEYIRDILLHNIVFGVMGKLGLQVTDIVGVYRSLAVDSGSMFDAILYIVAAGMNLVYTCIYIGLALEILIYFITFPIVCVKGVTDLSHFKAWAGGMVGLHLIPIADGILLLVPYALSSYGASQGPKLQTVYSGIALVCMGVMPAVRKTFLDLLGIKASGVADTAAALGTAGAAMIGGIVKKGLQTAKGVATSAGAAITSGKEAHTYKKMDEEYHNEANTALRQSAEAATQFGGGGSGFSRLDALNNGNGDGSMDKFANLSNYKDPAFSRNISYSKKAELARKDMWKNIGGAVGKMAGGGMGIHAGLAVGGGLGLGLGGTHGMSSMGIAGAEVGGDVGEAVGDKVGGRAGLVGLSAYDFTEAHAGDIEKGIRTAGAWTGERIENFGSLIEQGLGNGSFTPQEVIERAEQPTLAKENRLDEHIAPSPSPTPAVGTPRVHTWGERREESAAVIETRGEEIRAQIENAIGPNGAPRPDIGAMTTDKTIDFLGSSVSDVSVSLPSYDDIMSDKVSFGRGPGDYVGAMTDPRIYHAAVQRANEIAESYGKQAQQALDNGNKDLAAEFRLKQLSASGFKGVGMAYQDLLKHVCGEMIKNEPLFNANPDGLAPVGGEEFGDRNTMLEALAAGKGVAAASVGVNRLMQPAMQEPMGQYVKFYGTLWGDKINSMNRQS